MSDNNTQFSRILGVPICRQSLDQHISDAIHAIENKNEQIFFACANPHSIVEAQNDDDFLKALNNAEQVVADGVGVTITAKLLNIDVGPRIAGEDYYNSILDALVKRGHGRVFYFGSSQNVLDKIEARFGVDYPSLELAGLYSPPYGEWDTEKNEEMIQIINNASPDVLFVGMTAPKQEKWIYNNRNRLSSSVILAIGAVFDFYAGTYPRAPKIICELGLEWLYRFISEPRRMWKRNFVSAPVFVFKSLFERMFK